MLAGFWRQWLRRQRLAQPHLKPCPAALSNTRSTSCGFPIPRYDLRVSFLSPAIVTAPLHEFHWRAAEAIIITALRLHIPRLP